DNGRFDEAELVERQLLKTGRVEDPRTFSLFLSTRGIDAAAACEMARSELAQRADVYTHDAVAWALAARGDWDGAMVQSALALQEGTPDPRLLLHAAIINTHGGHIPEARQCLAKALRFQHMLLPSE